MAAPLLQFLVLGGPIPSPFFEQLGQLLSLVTDRPVAEVDGIFLVLRGDERPDTATHVREAAPQLPLFALQDGLVSISQRMAWIRAGADDLFDLKDAASALPTRIRRQPNVGGPAEPGRRIDRFLNGLARYLPLRESVLDALPESMRGKFFDLVRAREGVQRSVLGEIPVDLFGQQRGAERESFAWPATMLVPSERPIEIRNLGPDGLGLLLPVSLPADGRIVIQVEGQELRARLDIQVRWHRRVSKELWEGGGLVRSIDVLTPRQATPAGPLRIR